MREHNHKCRYDGRKTYGLSFIRAAGASNFWNSRLTSESCFLTSRLLNFSVIFSYSWKNTFKFSNFKSWNYLPDLLLIEHHVSSRNGLWQHLQILQADWSIAPRRRTSDCSGTPPQSIWVTLRHPVEYHRVAQNQARCNRARHKGWVTESKLGPIKRKLVSMIEWKIYKPIILQP